ncbi:gustatory and pheromone receptor 32a-like [Belonocnema kinseyi]|uniref:gustatory and pheromone receptor 32a-like n=1 Tax=Belonocnema kinseyi TaxID=2817044 RepID=UPI00143D434E|nr:gustatory and pheromone receptor 32a-like [Belonocnema kinseyi]
MPKSQNIQKVVLPISIISWLLGSGVIEFPVGHPRFVISFLYTLCIITAYGASMYYTLIYASFTYLKNVNNTGEFLFKILYYGNGFLAVTAVVLGWNRRKDLKKCIQSIGMVDESLQKIGITKDYDKTFWKEIGGTLGSLLIIVGVTIVNAYTSILKNAPFHVKIVLVVSAHYPIFLMFVADIMFLSIVRCMMRKFARLNALLKSMSSTTPLSPQYMKLLYHRSGLLKPTIVNGFSKKTNDDTHLMKAAKQVHLDLVKISRSVNETFGLLVLLSMALASVFITGLLYYSYTVIYLTTNPGIDTRPGLISACCWLFFYVIKILIVNHMCDRTSAEALRTGNIICELHEPMTNKEFRSEIREFLLQLIQNPLKFTAYDFVTLDYTFIQGVVGSITTYLVILIQLGGDISDSSAFSNSTKLNDTTS